MIQRIINYGICLIVFILPLYLVRFSIAWIPTNILEILICFLFVAWLVGFISEKEKFIKISKKAFFIYPVLLILFSITVSVWLSDNLEVSAGIWKSWFIIPLLFSWVVINSVENRKQAQNIIYSLFLSGITVSLIALYYYFNNNLTYDGRLKGFYLSANYLAMYLSPILILSFCLYSKAKKKFSKGLLIIGYGILISVIYLTYSYGAWLGLIAASLFIVIKMKKKKIAGIFLLIVILFILGQVNSVKMQEILDFSYPSLESRLVIWQSSWEIISDNLFIGISPGMFQKYYLEYQVNFEPYPEWAVPQPHNLFFAFWLQSGLLGLIGFIWLIILFFKELNRKIRRDTSNFLPIFIASAMICILIHGLIDTTYWKNDLSVIFWVIISLSYVEGRLVDYSDD